MKIHRIILLIPIILGLQLNLSGQSLPTDQELRDLMLKSWQQIEDYEVDIKLSLNIPGFRMPDRKIHYLYKAPDKSKVEVKGFAIVPKQGIQPFFTFLSDSLSLKPMADTLIDGRSVYEVVLQDTFMNKVGEIGFYIDQADGSIYEAWAIHEERKFFELKSEYTKIEGLSLPTSTEIKMLFPPDFKNIQRLGKKPNQMEEFNMGMTDEWLKGDIKITFKNYKVNQGIPDYRFEDDEADSIQD